MHTKTLVATLSLTAAFLGVIIFCVGIFGLYLTYQHVAQENIVTPPQASVPNKRVLGPLMLKVEADTIYEDVLKITSGQTYAQMPRQIPKLDNEGKPVLDENGKPVMTENTTRNTWVTALTLITALHVATFAYIVFGIITLFGIAIFLTATSLYFIHKNSVV